MQQNPGYYVGKCGKQQQERSRGATAERQQQIWTHVFKVPSEAEPIRGDGRSLDARGVC